MGLVKLATAFLAAAAVGRAVVELDAATAVPGAYIVEYEDDAVDTLSFVGGLDGASLRSDLRSKIFNGASIQFADVKKAEKVMAKIKFARGSRIKNVWPVRDFSLPGDIVHATGPRVVDYVTTPGANLFKRQAPAQDEFTPHVMTQVDRLRKAGFTGKGIKVAVVDTGIDYGHPALGGCFGPGCLVSFGEDIVGDAYTGASGSPAKGDPDPMDQCNGHGTHVAGIIAAQANNTYGITGGAPDVTLGAYRVFGCQGQVGNDVLIKAFLLAYKAGADIITASIGGANGWEDEPWSVVVSRIVAEGVVCTLSAGNDGSVGQFYASTASGGRGVTSIGSFDNIVTPSIVSTSTYSASNATGAYNFTASGNTPSWRSVNLPLWAVSFDTTDTISGCNPYPANTPNLTDHIVLVRRGNCTFTEKVTYAVAKGARHVLVYNNVEGANINLQSEASGQLAVAMIPAAQGTSWTALLKAGENVVVNLPDPDTAPKSTSNFPNAETGGFLSSYTSWGPTFEVNLKPQFSAPGGSILSTYPRELGAYAVLSGTSMSAPLAASIFALVMNVRGVKDPKILENLLAATAKPQLWKSTAVGRDLLAPAPQQGAGLMQAWDAAYATTHLGVSSLSFNDTDHFIPEKDFSIDNRGAKAVTYTVGHRPAAASYTFGANNLTAASALTTLEVVGQSATLAFSPSTFTLPAGAREIVTVKVTPPTGLDPLRLPVYSGYITLSGSDGSNFSFPYIGVAGSLHNTTVLYPGNVLIASSLDAANRPGLPVPSNTTFTLPPPGHANDTIYKARTAFPRGWFNLAFGSRLIRADLVALSNCSAAAQNSTTILGLKTVGPIEDFPARFNKRGLDYSDWTGLMADGSYAPPGRYKLVYRALRINGNPNLASEYDTAETQDFRIQYASLTKRKRAVRTKGMSGKEAVKGK